ncbi:hypothetical protein [Nocardioides sp. MH1]|uniref:hypothetical protein n=1 Tax=Nocardioides sp. MH1 TaxID=3242490 RepID=UPI003521E4A5
MICGLALQMQAQLLDLDRTVREIDRLTHPATSPGAEPADHQPTTTALASRIGDTLEALWGSLHQSATHVHDVVDSVPQWLGADSREGGLGLLLLRTADLDNPASPATGPIWASVTEAMREQHRFWRLEALSDEWITQVPTSRQARGSYALHPCSPTSQATPIPGSSTAPEPRSLTVCFPVVHEVTGNGMLIAMDLTEGGAITTRGDPTAKAADRSRAGEPHGVSLTPEFRGAVRAARNEAIAVAQSMGVDDADLASWSHIEPARVHGVPDGYIIRDESAGAPTALNVLGAILGLPPLRQIASGAVTLDGTLLPLPEGSLPGKVTAARDAGVDLLPLTDAQPLRSVAEHAWGPAWDEAEKSTALNALRSIGVDVQLVTDIDLPTSPSGEHAALATTPTQLRLRSRVSDGDRTAIVGGANRTGRTTEARRLAMDWATPRHGNVIEVRTEGGKLPEGRDLVRICELAKRALSLPESPVALVLEDLIPYEDATDLDASLIPAASEDQLVVAVCLYTGGTRWTCEQVINTPTVRGTEQALQFAHNFLTVNTLECNEEVTALAVREAQGDLWLLTRLLIDLAHPSSASQDLNTAAALLGNTRSGAGATPQTDRPATPADTDITARSADGGGHDPSAGTQARPAERANAIVREHAERTQAGMTDLELADARAVAAASLLGIAVPAAMLRHLSVQQVRRLGGHSDHLSRWFISRGATCRAVLHGCDAASRSADQPQWRRTAQEQFAALKAFLDPFLSEPDDQTTRLVTALVRSAGAVEQRLHRQLLNLATDMFTHHLRSTSSPALLAYALLAGGHNFDHTTRRELFATFLRSLSAQGWGGLKIREATSCLYALRAHRDLLNNPRDPDPDNLLADYRDVLRDVSTQMRTTLAQAPPSEGMRFIHELGLFFDELAARDLPALASLATERANPYSIQDHRAVVKLIDDALKYSWDRRQHQTLEAMRHSRGIKTLLAVTDHDEAGLVLAQHAIRLLLYSPPDPEPLHKRIGIATGRKLPHSEARIVAEGLLLLREVDRWAARVVVSTAGFDTWLRRDLWAEDSRVAPFVSALTMRALTRAHPAVLLSALHDPDGTPSESVLTSLTDSITATGDLKAVGHVLGAVAAVDTTYGPGGAESFTRQLTSRLLPLVRHGLSSELRSTVVLHTVSALLAGELPADELRGLLERCCRVVAAEAHDNDKDSAARLALLLAQHNDVGTEFLTLLDPEISNDLLLHRICESQSITARGAYLQLSCALDRTSDRTFVSHLLERHWLPTSLVKLRSTDCLSALQALHAYAGFLTEAGIEFHVQALLDETHPGGDWAIRLRQLHHPGQLSQALSVLRKMSPTAARNATARLDTINTAGHWLTAPPRNPNLTVTAAPSKVAPTPGGETTTQTTPASAPPPTPLSVARAHRNRSTPAPGLTRLVQRQFVNPARAVELVQAIYKVDPPRARGIGRDLTAHESWNARVRGILDMDTAAQVGATLIMMSRATMWLNDRHLHLLRRDWLSQAATVRSVRSAESMLRGLVAACRGDSTTLAAEWADALRIRAIGSRLSQGSPGDLERAATLINALSLWGPDGSAALIAQHLPGDATQRTTPRTAALLLEAIHDIDPGLAAAHASAASQALIHHATRGFVVNHNRHWHQLGQLAITVNRLAPGTTTLQATAAAMTIPDTRTRAWAIAALGGSIDPAWADADSSSRATWSSTARLARVLALSRAGLSASLDATDLAREVAATVREAGHGWRAELLRCAAVDPILRTTLTPSICMDIAEDAESELAVGEPEAARVKDLLFALL